MPNIAYNLSGWNQQKEIKFDSQNRLKNCLFDMIYAIFCKNSDDVMFSEIYQTTGCRSTPTGKEVQSLASWIAAGQFRND